MKIDLEEVRRVAALAHLALDADREEALRLDLDRILEYVEKLNEIDTSGVGPASEPARGDTALRADGRGSSLDPEEALANAPEAGDGHFKVPRVLPG